MKKITLIIFLLCAYFSNAQLREDNFTIKNITENTKYQDFGVSYFGEKKVVFASSRRTKTIRNNIWKENGQPYLQNFQGTLSNGEILEVELFAKGINTKFHDANLTFTKDLKTAYFTSNNYLNKKFKKDTLGKNLNQLYKAQIGEDGKWENVEAMPFNNDDYQTGHPALSSDETKLYFISDMPGGFGLTDIYVVDILADGTYGEPINLGPNVNTAGREMFPYVTNLDYLYFSSDGYVDGKGGLDVYVTKVIGNESKPSFNLESPVNTIADDFAFIFQEGKNIGYFSSNRSGGKGDDDIYAFTELKPLSLYCDQFVSGNVIDGVTGEPVDGAEIVLYGELDNEVGRMFVEGENAEFKFEVPCNQDYKIVASKDNYTTRFKKFFLEYGNDLVIPLEIEIDEFLTAGGKCLININPIYFDFDESFIRPDAEIELDRVVGVMNKYPLLRIEAGSHTDSRGYPRYNQQLSTRRAKSTVNYLIEQGIDSSRLSWKGYGATQLANDCPKEIICTEAQHQFNRRSEFLIVNAEEVKEVYSSICDIETVSAKEQIEELKIVKEIFENDIENKRKQAFYNDYKYENESLYIAIDPLQFELNSVDLDSEIKDELNTVIMKMKEYPTIIVECGSHTDSRSSHNSNMDLSQNRARSIVNYIITGGINPTRIIARGYGETVLVNNCAVGVKCTELEHAENRRVEFIVLNPIVLFKDGNILEKE